MVYPSRLVYPDSEIWVLRRCLGCWQAGWVSMVGLVATWHTPTSPWDDMFHGVMALHRPAPCPRCHTARFGFTYRVPPTAREQLYHRMEEEQRPFRHSVYGPRPLRSRIVVKGMGVDDGLQ